MITGPAAAAVKASTRNARIPRSTAGVNHGGYLFCDEPNSGLDPKTSLVIDELIHDITTEYNMTTVINTHDMNSVLGIGDSILYIYQGHKEWEGTKNEVFTATNQRLNDFIFASDLLKKVKTEGEKENR